MEVPGALSGIRSPLGISSKEEGRLNRNQKTCTECVQHTARSSPFLGAPFSSNLEGEAGAGEREEDGAVQTGAGGQDGEAQDRERGERGAEGQNERLSTLLGERGRAG